jgi:Skp family chaperone for outer membrane proteins
MRLLSRLLAAAVPIGMLLCAAVPAASAQAAGEAAAARAALPPVVGVLDVNHVLTRGKAARNLLEQRETYVEAYQAEVADTEIELRQQDQELMQQRATLKPEVFNSRRQEFQNRVNTFQQQVQTRRDNLEKAFGAAMNAIQAKVIEVTKEVAETRGMNIVLYRSQTFLFDPEMDITETVLAEVNRRLPSVTMQDPDSVTAAPAGDKQAE